MGFLSSVHDFMSSPLELCMTLSLKAKKRWTNISTGIFFLFGGIEYAIIMPTVYLYIQDKGGDPSFLGFVLAAFSFTGLIAAPIFGVLQDKYHNTKFLVLFANLFEIIGNFMYFVGINLAMLLGSRLIAGIGAGVGSSLFAQIARTTTEAERAGTISMAMAARQVGLLFGPGLNLFLKDLDFYIGPFNVNALSSPGLFMCLLWFLLQIFFFLFYFDLPPLSEEDKQAIQEAPNSRPSTPTIPTAPPQPFSSSVNVLVSGRTHNDTSYLSQSLPNSGLTGSYEEGGVVNITPMWGSSNLVEDPRARAFSTQHSRELVNPSERHAGTDIKPDLLQNVDLETGDLYDRPPPVEEVKDVPGLSPVKEDDGDSPRNGSSGYGSSGQAGSDTMEGKRPKTWQEEYLREEIVVLLASQFIFFFNQTVLETALTPMTKVLLNFGELENSVLYCICGVEVVLGFVIVKYLSKFVSDRALLLTGFIIELISVVWLLIFYPTAEPGQAHENIFWVAIGVLAVVAGLPFLSVTTISLFSKLTSVESQGHYSYNMMWFCSGCIVQVSGLAALSVAIISLFSKVTLIETQDDTTFNLASLAISSTILMVGIPFTAVSAISLYSKLTSQERQGFSQGIRRAVGGLATIMGPLWAGATVEMGYVMFGVMTFLFVFIIILMTLSWSKLKSPADIAKQKEQNANQVPSNETDERSPLLSSNPNYVLSKEIDEKSPLLINADVDDHIEA